MAYSAPLSGATRKRVNGVRPLSTSSSPSFLIVGKNGQQIAPASSVSSSRSILPPAPKKATIQHQQQLQPKKTALVPSASEATLMREIAADMQRLSPADMLAKLERIKSGNTFARDLHESIAGIISKYQNTAIATPVAAPVAVFPSAVFPSVPKSVSKPHGFSTYRPLESPAPPKKQSGKLITKKQTTLQPHEYHSYYTSQPHVAYYAHPSELSHQPSYVHHTHSIPHESTYPRFFGEGEDEDVDETHHFEEDEAPFVFQVSSMKGKKGKKAGKKAGKSNAFSHVYVPTHYEQDNEDTPFDSVPFFQDNINSWSPQRASIAVERPTTQQHRVSSGTTSFPKWPISPEFLQMNFPLESKVEHSAGTHAVPDAIPTQQLFVPKETQVSSNTTSNSHNQSTPITQITTAPGTSQSQLVDHLQTSSTNNATTNAATTGSEVKPSSISINSGSGTGSSSHTIGQTSDALKRLQEVAQKLAVDKSVLTGDHSKLLASALSDLY